MTATMRYELQAIQSLKKTLLKEAEEVMGERYPTITEQFQNQGRYCVLRFKTPTQCVKYFIMFKKEAFHSFGTITGEQGEGESINQEDYIRYAADCYKMIYVHQTPHKLLYRYIYPCFLKSLGEKGKLHSYTNKADGKKQFLFSTKWLSEL